MVIDEAQHIKDIGLKLKLITDELPEVQLIATGSSSFDLANEVNEPLTGRKWEYKMHPISFAEMVEHHGLLDEKRLLPHRLVYGYYPDVVSYWGDEKEILRQLSDSYLYKDILMWEQIKEPEKLLKLLQALAFQIGNIAKPIRRNTHLISKRTNRYTTTIATNDHAAVLTFVSNHTHTTVHTNLSTSFMLIPDLRLFFVSFYRFSFP